jgi:Zn-dependent peptidase ImmA (M78 family)
MKAVERPFPRRIGEEFAAMALAGAARQLPVDLEALARGMGVSEIKFGNLREDGRTTWAEGRTTIEVRADRPHPRQRFTLAHEIAHVLLANNRQRDVRLRKSSLDQDSEERLCDWIAAAILMPLEWIRPLSHRPMTLRQLRAVASAADVSLSAAAVRISEVGARPCILLRWKRGNDGRWVLVGMAGVPHALVGRVSISSASSQEIGQVRRQDMYVDVELTFSSTQMAPCRAQVSRAGSTVMMLVAEQLKPVDGP